MFSWWTRWRRSEPAPSYVATEAAHSAALNTDNPLMPDSMGASHGTDHAPASQTSPTVVELPTISTLSSISSWVPLFDSDSPSISHAPSLFSLDAAASPLTHETETIRRRHLPRPAESQNTSSSSLDTFVEVLSREDLLATTTPLQADVADHTHGESDVTAPSSAAEARLCLYEKTVSSLCASFVAYAHERAVYAEQLWRTLRHTPVPRSLAPTAGTSLPFRVAGALWMATSVPLLLVERCEHTVATKKWLPLTWTDSLLRPAESDTTDTSRLADEALRAHVELSATTLVRYLGRFRTSVRQVRGAALEQAVRTCTYVRQHVFPHWAEQVTLVLGHTKAAPPASPTPVSGCALPPRGQPAQRSCRPVSCSAGGAMSAPTSLYDLSAITSVTPCAGLSSDPSGKTFPESIPVNMPTGSTRVIGFASQYVLQSIVIFAL